MTPSHPDEGHPSPSIMAYANTFSEEEIDVILGAMNSHDDCLSKDANSDDGHTNSSSHLGDQHPNSITLNETTGNNSSDNKNNNADVTGTGTANCRAQARSERKRSREKQRREDVNKHFADLTQLLRQVELEDEEDSNNKWIPITTIGPTNRVDLIARTIVVVERMRRVSAARKQEITDLNRQIEDLKKIAEDTAARLKEATLYQQGPQKPQVMMMVPMMVNPETMGGATSAAAGFMSHQHLPQQMPFMPQQMMMMPPVAQAPTPAAQPPQQQTQQQLNSNMAPTAQPTMPTMQMMHPMMQSMMMPHPMMQQQSLSYSAMMFPTQTSSSNLPIADTPTQSQNQSSVDGQQQHGKSSTQQPSSGSTSSGGNLAHCA